MPVFPVISSQPHVQAAYLAMRRSGQSHAIAELLACRQAPGAVTDREFLAGHCNGSQFAADPAAGNQAKKIAESQGMNTTGKVYLSGLARYYGDPKAWVSGRGDVQKVCEERGWQCDGMVKVKPRQTDQEPEKVAIGEDIVNEAAAKALRDEPDLRKKPVREIKEMVRERHLPKRRR